MWKSPREFQRDPEHTLPAAVMKEALRVHSAAGLPLWRVVPEHGVHICVRFFPEGTVIGLNTWCADHDQDVFGKDAETLRPERWRGQW